MVKLYRRIALLFSVGKLQCVQMRSHQALEMRELVSIVLPGHPVKLDVMHRKHLGRTKNALVPPTAFR